MSLNALQKGTKEYPRSIGDELLIDVIKGAECFDYQQLTVDHTAAVALTIPADAKQCLIMVDADAGITRLGRAIRWRHDGTAPTASVGMLFGDLSILHITNDLNMANMKMIGIDTGLSHTVNVHYYK